MNFIEPETLCEWLTTDTTDSVVIIDVRDEDYPDGGSILGAQNIPSAQFTDHVQQLAMRYHDKPHRIVFHCMYVFSVTVIC
jgi:rhodanese-related sulfurtransferase